MILIQFMTPSAGGGGECEIHRRDLRRGIRLPRQRVFLVAQSAGVAEYTDCVSADFPNECPVMTLNNLMVRFQ